MTIWKNGFEKTKMDTIAVIYNLTDNRTAIKPDMLGRYKLLDGHTYLIICGKSEYRVENKSITRTFISKDHPLFVPSEVIQ